MLLPLSYIQIPDLMLFRKGLSKLLKGSLAALTSPSTAIVMLRR